MRSRWSLSFIPKEAAFGILSVLLPLYVVEELNGNLLDIGVIVFVNSIIRIPAVILWARLVNREARYKTYILVSFLVSGLTLFLFTTTNSVGIFLVLNVLLSLFAVAVSPTTRVLIAESNPRVEWEAAFAQHRLVLGVGATIGLFAGAVWMTQLGNRSLMLLCSVLVTLSLGLAAVLIQKPTLMFVRRLARSERFVNLAEHASHLVSAPTTYRLDKEYFTRYPSLKPLSVGIFLFPFATTLVLTSVPIFLSSQIGASSSLIFVILLMKTITLLVGYRRVERVGEEKGVGMIRRATILSIFFPALILVSGFLPSPFAVTGSAVALAIAGFAWSYFSVFSTTLWMELAPPGMPGIYNASRSLGTALGGLLGGVIPLYYGYDPLFILSIILYGLSLLFLTRSAHMKHL